MEEWERSSVGCLPHLENRRKQRERGKKPPEIKDLGCWKRLESFRKREKILTRVVSRLRAPRLGFGVEIKVFLCFCNQVTRREAAREKRKKTTPPRPLNRTSRKGETRRTSEANRQTNTALLCARLRLSYVRWYVSTCIYFEKKWNFRSNESFEKFGAIKLVLTTLLSSPLSLLRPEVCVVHRKKIPACWNGAQGNTLPRLGSFRSLFAAPSSYSWHESHMKSDKGRRDPRVRVKRRLSTAAQRRLCPLRPCLGPTKSTINFHHFDAALRLHHNWHLKTSPFFPSTTTTATAAAEQKRLFFIHFSREYDLQRLPQVFCAEEGKKWKIRKSPQKIKIKEVILICRPCLTLRREGDVEIEFRFVRATTKKERDYSHSKVVLSPSNRTVWMLSYVIALFLFHFYSFFF